MNKVFFEQIETTKADVGGHTGLGKLKVLILGGTFAKGIYYAANN